MQLEKTVILTLDIFFDDLKLHNSTNNGKNRKQLDLVTRFSQDIGIN